MDQSTKGDVRTPGFNTLAIHAGAQPDPTTGARATPIYQTTSFVFDDVDHAAALFGLQTFGNIYSRITNPTCAVLEERVAALEGGTAALAVASGHAAQVVAFHNLLKPGDEFIASKKLYGGSINQFNHAFKNFGWNVVWADPDDIGTFERAISPKTKAIFVESIANPGGVITDIEAVAVVDRLAQIRRRQGVVDDQRDAGLVRDGRDLLDIDDDAAGIGEALDKDRLAARRQRPAEILRVGRIDEMALPAELRE